MTSLDPDTLARALLSVARERVEPQAVAGELAEVTRILASVPLLKRTLNDPGIPAEERRSIVSDVLGDILSPVTLGLLDLLIDENQVNTVHAVATMYQRLLDEDRGVVRAHVTSAVKLSPADVETLRAGLAQKLSGSVAIEQEVDPGILGGLIVRVGDTVFDGSVAGRLRKLREELETTSPVTTGETPADAHAKTGSPSGTAATTSVTGNPPPAGPSAAPSGE
ncbi:MAG: ATP synthase F1 subunit delta [Betaproteobacteria bacterium]